VAEVFPLERIPAEVREIARVLRGAGHEAWYVGGAVRDFLLAGRGVEVRRLGDFDIATSAVPEQVQRLFRRTVPIGVEHGTVAVLDAHDGAHEVTTFRRDVRTDGRHAEVEFGASLDEDLRGATSPSTRSRCTPRRARSAIRAAGARTSPPACCAPSAIPRRGSGRTGSACSGRCGSPRRSA